MHWRALVRSPFALAFAASLFWLAIILRIGSPHLTLSPGWADAVSHLYTTPLFWSEGFDLYRRPTADFLDRARGDDESKRFAEFAEHIGVSPGDVYTLRADAERRPIFIVSPNVPRPYPPGLYLFMSPFSFLLSALGIKIALSLLCGVWLYVIHLATWVFFTEVTRHFQPQNGIDRTLVGVATAIAYFELLRWTLNSQYDGLAVFLLFVCVRMRREQHALRSLLFFAGAIFLHFRSLFFLPAALFTLAEWKKKIRISQIPVAKLAMIFVGLAAIAVSFQAFVWNIAVFQSAQLYDLNSLHWSKLGPGTWGKTLGLIAGFGAIAIYWWRNRLHAALACAAFTCLMLLQTRLVREWYALFLLPIVLLAISERPEQRRVSLLFGLAFYTLFAAMFLNNSPFEFRLVHELIEAVRRSS